MEIFKLLKPQIDDARPPKVLSFETMMPTANITCLPFAKQFQRQIQMMEPRLHHLVPHVYHRCEHDEANSVNATNRRGRRVVIVIRDTAITNTITIVT